MEKKRKIVNEIAIIAAAVYIDHTNKTESRKILRDAVALTNNQKKNFLVKRDNDDSL